MKPPPHQEPDYHPSLTGALTAPVGLWLWNKSPALGHLEGAASGSGTQ